jgi:glycosyltransferase involved in cell wall biosynthesis
MNITLIYNKSSTQIRTVNDHVMSFKKYSKHDINLIDQNDFNNIYKIKSDTVILHYSIIHSVAWCLSKFINIIKLKDGISKEAFRKLINNKEYWATKELHTSHFFHLTNFLLSYNGHKFAFIQDEYYDTNLIKMFLEIININTVFTCIPNEHISRIYDNLNNTGFIYNLTGYVPEYNFHRIPIKDRNCDVFYRGRELHYWYGDLGQDKMNIGKYMKKYCEKYKLITNIDWNGENCIYGDEWFKVLGNSKVTLATESGSTIFDLDNTILVESNTILKHFPVENVSFPKNPIYTYNEFITKINLKKNEIKNMGQISPKMFEAIMLGTVLVMYEGYYYPDILIPDVHYIVLKKDYSNINDVINKIKDDNFLQNMANRAYNDIIKSDLYSYKKFIEMFDKEVENPYMYKPNYQANKNLSLYGKTKYMKKSLIINNLNEINFFFKSNILLLRSEPFGYDPRRDYWYEKGLSSKYSLYHSCVFSNTMDERIINNDKVFNKKYEDIWNYSLNDIKILFYNNITYKDYINKFNKIYNLFKYLLEDYDFSNSKFTTQYKTEAWFIKYFIVNTYYHLYTFFQYNIYYNFKIIIAINLPQLFAGIIIKSIFNDTYLVYECLEYYPNSQTYLDENVECSNYLKLLEQKLIETDYIDYYNIVSPQLAILMTNIYNKNFNYVPNVVPLSISNNIDINLNKIYNNKSPIIFLFQGGISTCRNLDLLIKIWNKTNINAHLVIRGPYWNYVDELKIKSGDLLNKRIYFFESINPTNQFKLLEGINNDCDIGIIPYSPLNINYKYSSPNKMGEYISMGKPILANNTEYVSQIITEADCGIVIDFKNENLLIDSINKLTTDIQLRKKYSENAFKYYQKEFNWENKSQNFYHNIYNFIKDK